MSFTKQLTDEQIESSREIQNWLSQFETTDYSTAKNLLLQLMFVSENSFMLWIKKFLNEFSHNIAVYPIVKLQDQPFWDDNGNIVKREYKGQGSEDVIFSIMANCCKSKNHLFNCPSTNVLKDKKIRHIFLLDDSCNSGERVCEFLQEFLKNKAIRSWYSYNLIKIHIVSFAVSDEAEKNILSFVRGKTKRHRKIKIREKIFFHSHFKYNKNDYFFRWGDDYEAIKSFCQKTLFNKSYKLGYHDSMSNIIFFHSIPNNLPGCLWLNKKWKYKALFPRREVPSWLIELFNGQQQQPVTINKNIYSILFLIKKGLRKNISIATRLNLDISLVDNYLKTAEQSGFITSNNSLTNIGNSALMKKDINLYQYNWGLYLPQKWG